MSALSSQIELFYSLELMPNSLTVFKRWVIEIEKNLKELQEELKINSEKIILKKEVKARKKVEPNRRSLRLRKKKMLKRELKNRKTVYNLRSRSRSTKCFCEIH